MDAPWRIELLGRLRAVQGERVVARFSTHKHGALLAYLAYHRDRPHPRAELIELLWPECEPDAGRNRLRVALTSLRHQLEPPGIPAGSVIVAEGANVQLNPAIYTSDVSQFEAALHAATHARSGMERMLRLTEAVESYSGELLPAYFEAWVLPERQRLAEQFQRALEGLILHLERAGDLPRALHWARRAISADPLREEAHHDLIRLLAAAGQPEAALRQYDELDRLLAQETGAEPADDTRELVRDIRRRAAAGAKKLAERLPCSSSRTVAPATARPLPSAPLPTGTVTFLLTDIERSTAQWERAGEAFRIALAGHHDLLRRLFGEHGGHEVKETGDGFIVAFQHARDALGCAVAGQLALAAHRWPDDLGPPRVRMALHTGDVRPEDGDYHGLPLRLAQRLLVAGHGGQILCSESTAALLRRNPGEGVWLVDLGVYRLRDVVAPERVFQVDYAGMATSEFPPLNAEAGYAGHLPPQFTRFFGREEEIDRLRELLLGEAVGSRPSALGEEEPTIPDGREPTADGPRLVTLTGPGGSGKTRLALAAAEGLRKAFAGAIWFVPLQELSDPGLILSQTLASLRIPHAPQIDPLEQLATALSRQPTLLLFDNFEHLAPAGAAWIQALLERVPALTGLITSRQRLNLPGEREFPVPPLPVPVDGSWLMVDGPAKAGPPNSSTISHQPSVLAHCPSVQLFVDRAQAARPDFQITRANAAAVARLCAQLEGLPLALELAAARAGVLTPAQMLARLEQRFDLLTVRHPASPSRHRSLRAALDWSFQLLSPELQRFFARLSVFRGGWTLEAAEAVCDAGGAADEGAGGGGPGPGQALDYLQQLRECSLVLAEEMTEGLSALGPRPSVRSDSGPPTADGREPTALMRFRLLETLREYGWEQLTATEREALERQHAVYYLELAEAAEPHLRDVDQEEWLPRLRREHDNLRAALAWSQVEAKVGETEEMPLQPERREIGLRLAGALWWFYHYYCLWNEGREWLEKTLAAAGSLASQAARAKALRGAGQLAWHQGDLAVAEPRLEESLGIWRGLGDRLGCAYSLMFLGGVALSRNDPAQARSLGEESVALFRDLEDGWGLGQSLYFLALAWLAAGDAAAARRLHEEGLAIFRKRGDRWRIAWGLHHLGQVAYSQDDVEMARSLYQEGLTLFREVDNPWSIAVSLDDLGRLEFDRQAYTAAQPLFEESLAIWRELGNRPKVASRLLALAQTASARGQYGNAQPLFQESLALWRAFGKTPGITRCIEGLAEVVQAEGQLERAARLLGAAAVLRESMGEPVASSPPSPQAERAAALRAALGERRFLAAWTAGCQLHGEQAVLEALAEGGVDERVPGV